MTTRWMKIIALSLLLLLTACNFPLLGPTADPTSASDPIATAAALTVQALSTQLASAQAATNPPPPTLTLPAPATATQPTVTATTAPAAPTAVLLSPTPPCDKLGKVEDVTIPDGSEFNGGETFTKKWKLTNAGSCTWTSDYAVVFSEGASMDAPASVAMPGSVPPNGSITVSIDMKAPTTAGQHQGYWKIKNSAGTKFGWGTAADKAFWVLIKVASSPFAVISVPTTVDPASWSGACPKTFTFTANIKTSAAGVVKYHWERSDGATSPVETLTYDAAGTKTVTSTWSLGAPGPGWKAIYIDEPNHQLFAKAEFTLACP